MTTKKRIEIIDLLRGVSIIFVIIHHANINDHWAVLGFPFYVHIAVPIFVILTAYNHYGGTMNYQLWDKEYVQSLLRVLSRVIVPYTLTYFAYLLLKQSFGDNPLNMGQIFKLYFTGRGTTGGYYFSIMLQFLVFLPIIKYFSRFSRIKVLSGALIFNVVYEIIIYILGVRLGYELSDIYFNIAFRYVFMLTSGYYLYEFIRDENRKLINRLMTIGFVVSMIYFYICIYRDVDLFGITLWKHSSYVITLYTLPIVYFMIRKFADVQFKGIFKALCYCGKASWHIMLAQSVWFEASLTINTSLIVNVTVSIIFSVIAGCIFYYGEIMVRHWIKQKKQLRNMTA